VSLSPEKGKLKVHDEEPPPEEGGGADSSARDEAAVREKGEFMLLLSELCRTVESQLPATRRPRLPLHDVVYAMALKTYLTFSTARSMHDVGQAKEKGFIGEIPHHSSIDKYMQAKGVTPYLEELIRRSSLPLRPFERDFAIDSTPFESCHFYAHKNKKTGEVVIGRRGVRLHIICGVRSHIITAAMVSASYKHDTKFFEPLLRMTHALKFNIDSIAGDKGYFSERNMLLAKELGVKAYLTPKRNASAEGKNRSQEWRDSVSQYRENEENSAKHYRMRSNVETTFSIIKRVFGNRLRTKLTTAQVNEVLCKVLCQNLRVLIQYKFQLGIKLDFSAERSE
jgi:transposase